MLAGASHPPGRMQDVQAFIRPWACSRLSVPSIGWVSDTLSYVSLPARSKVCSAIRLPPAPVRRMAAENIKKTLLFQ